MRKPANWIDVPCFWRKVKIDFRQSRLPTKARRLIKFSIYPAFSFFLRLMWCVTCKRRSHVLQRSAKPSILRAALAADAITMLCSALISHLIIEQAAGISRFVIQQKRNTDVWFFAQLIGSIWALVAFVPESNCRIQVQTNGSVFKSFASTQSGGAALQMFSNGSAMDQQRVYLIIY